MKILLIISLISLYSCGQPLSGKGEVQASQIVSEDTSTDAANLSEPTSVHSSNSWATSCVKNYNPSFSYQEVVEQGDVTVTYVKAVYNDLECEDLRELWTKTYLYEDLGEDKLNLMLIRNKVTFFGVVLIYSLNNTNFCNRTWESGRNVSVINNFDCALPEKDVRFGNQKTVNFLVEGNSLTTNLTSSPNLSN